MKRLRFFSRHARLRQWLRFKWLLWLAACVTLQAFALDTSQVLNLQRAEQLALEQDSVLKSLRSQVKAMQELAVSARAWPDPKIEFGAQAVPTGSYELDQEAMTQLVVGYRQQLPRGDSLRLSSEKADAVARQLQARFEQRRRHVISQVHLAWLDLLLQNESIEIIQASRGLFEKMLDISQAYYAAGRQQQQDIVQAELEIALLDDRLVQLHSRQAQAIAALQKWLGTSTIQTNTLLQDKFKLQVPLQLEALEQRLMHHPELLVAQQQVMHQHKQLQLANQQYAPQWGFNLRYGKRDGFNPDGSQRDDFLTAMMSVDLPLFTDNKQDRQVAAATQQLQSSRYQQQDIKRDLQRRLQQALARLEKLGDRYQLYLKRVLPQSKQNAEVALSGYQSGVVSFFTLTRARITELNTRLALLRIKIDYQRAFAQLSYLTGDEQ